MSKVDLIEECFTRGWTDGLPVVPPTRARVERMLGDRIDQRDEVVATLRAAHPYEEPSFHVLENAAE